MVFRTANSHTTRDYRAFVATCIGLVVAYCVTVLWNVATFPDVGLRCLLPEGPALASEVRPPDLKAFEAARGLLSRGFGQLDPHGISRVARSKMTQGLDAGLQLLTLSFGRETAGGAYAGGQRGRNRASVSSRTVENYVERPIPSAGIEIWEWIRSDSEKVQPAPKAGDRLVRLNGQPIGTFLDCVSALESARRSVGSRVGSQ